MITPVNFRKRSFAYFEGSREIRAPNDSFPAEEELLGLASTAPHGSPPVMPWVSPSPLRLTLFGGPSLSHGSEILSLSPYQGALLGILATYGQRGIRRGELLALLWDDGDDELLRRRLNQLIYSLHKRLHEEKVIRLVGDIYMFEEGHITSDLEFFLASLRDGRLCDATGIVGRGFLTGLETTPSAAFERWVESRELRYRSDVRTLASDRWREGEQRADWLMAEEAAETLLRLNQDDESALRKLMEARALRGKVSEAEVAYIEFLDLAHIEDPTYELEEETERLISRFGELRREHMTTRPNLSTPSSRDTLPLVGRIDELGLLTQTIRNTRSDELQILSVVGEGGIGKTRLIQEVLSRAPFDGIRVLSGRCSEFERNIPLSPILGALTSNWVSLALQDLSDPWRSILRQHLPDHAIEVPIAETAILPRTEDIPRVTCDAFFRLFQALAEADPVVLFLDDVQWIDTTSLSVLEYIRERWEGGGLTILLAMRDGEVASDSRLGRWLAAESTRQRLPPLILRALDRPDITRLLESSLSHRREEEDASTDRLPKWIDDVIEFADGHPLLALECVRLLTSPGAQLPKHSGQVPIPETLREMVSRRASHLSREGERLIHLLSVSDKPLPISILEASCGFGPGVIVHAMDEAVKRQFLTVSPRGIDFQHSLLRNAIYQGLTPGARTAAHRSIAIALSSQNDSGFLMDIALHLLMAGDPRKAIPFVLDAARSVTDSGGWEEARRLLLMALESDLTLTERGEVAALLGHLLILLGDFEEAEIKWAEAERTYNTLGKIEDALSSRLGVLEAQRHQPNTDKNALLKSVRALRDDAADLNLRRLVAECFDTEVRMLDVLRRFDDVRGITTEVLTLVDHEDIDAHVQLLLVSSIEAVYGDPVGAGRLADKAAEIANANNRPDLLLKALNWKIISLGHEGRLNAIVGRQVIDRAINLAKDSKDFAQKFLLHSNLGVWNIDTGNYSAAERFLNRAGNSLGGLAVPHLRRSLLINQGQVALEVGDMLDAIQTFQSSLQVPGAVEYIPAYCCSMAGLGLSHLKNGGLTEARTIRASLPKRPDSWSFDPYLWIAFETRLSALTGPDDNLIKKLLEEEEKLQKTVALAWVRIRLMRFEILFRWKKTPLPKDVRSLSLFLIENELKNRAEELQKLLARFRYSH